MGKYGTTDSRVANNSLIGNSRMKYNGTDSEYLLVKLLLETNVTKKEYL